MTPWRAKRICLDCHRLTDHGSRCEKCCTSCFVHRDYSKVKRPPNMAYTQPEYRRLRARILAAWIKEHGHWCPGAPDLRHAPHPAIVLTLDHIIPIRNGGTHDEGNLRVLCRSANASRSRGGRGAIAN